MSCYHPREAFMLINERSESGRQVVVWSRPDVPYKSFEVTCGKCIGCQLDKARDWSLRCIHESQLHDRSCFVTLTYSDEFLPDYGTLVPRDVQLFFKRLREAIEPVKVRYFMCGEYGDANARPHYHIILFGYDFPDKRKWRVERGNVSYRSDELEKLWRFGHAEIGSVTPQSCEYVARYALKKVYGKDEYGAYVQSIDFETGELKMRLPPYVRMSRRPGIGYDWVLKYVDDLLKNFLTQDKKKYRVPSYYLQVVEKEYPEFYDEVKRRRAAFARDRAPVSLLELRKQEKCREAKAERLERTL